MLQEYKFPYHYAKYTIQFQDVLRDDNTILNFIQLDTPEQTEKFIKIFKSRWNIYEISGETIKEFKDYLHNCYGIYKDYYQELINGYETKINMLDGKKSSITINNNKTIQANRADNNTTNNDEYDFPNKVTSSQYLTGKETTTGSATSDYDETNTQDIITTKTGDINVIELKKQYLELIKNVYLDFVNEFKHCFIQLYD